MTENNKRRKLTAIIIDDDIPSIRLLAEELSRRDNIQLCATAESLQEGENIIAKYQPDLIFLDMNFPEGNGLAWYEGTTLPDHTKVVFHTCYQRYIHDALSLRVFDFLLKPFDSSELDVIIRRLQDIGTTQQRPSSMIGNLPTLSVTHSGAPRLISITSVTNSKVIVNPSDIVYFRYMSDRKIWECVFYTLKRIILKRQTTAETILGYGPDFVRTHKQFIVNIRYVGIINGNDCILLPPLDNITEIKISKTYRRDLMDRFYDI
ncbi:MAG: LytTR family DNA-binding domain-containing protein [Muribaculaceae bacterium]|nr:LytTR family DNA-binding domain-containing protein [Muribaculaceae bacterium]